MDADDIQEILNLDFRKLENKERLEYQTGYDSAFCFRKAIKKDLQTIKKFLKEYKILDKFGVVARFSNGETIYKKTKKEAKMIKTSNNKKTIEKIKNHILGFYTVEELKKEVENLKGWDGIYTDSQALKKMVEGSCFLVYFYEVRETLKDWLENLYDDKIDDTKAWDFYKNKIAIVGKRLIK